ncbi:MAG: transglycosylase SLT domain-containing protein [Deltaproteobacteria bacterium]|nr:transglycosylase SLT domain-containing protein [Deltaproteobacteria bacterium]
MIQFRNVGTHPVHTKPAFLFFALTLIGAVVAVSGCATSRPRDGGGAVGNVIREAAREAAPASTPQTSTAVTGVSSGNPVFGLNEDVSGRKLKVTRFDYPVVVNPSVEKWVAYFTGKGRRYFSKYLERGRYFIPEIAKVLKQNNMPQDLVYLAMIESGFNNSARSHARAVGPWQFIRPTGVRYGLNVNYWLDERRDTRKATTAAINYLRELYQEFGSWELAASAYNAGENKVRRAVSKYRTHNFWEIAKHRFFKRETRDYVPKIMAAAIITKNPELFGFEDPFRKGYKRVTNPTVSMLSENGEEPTPKELAEEIAKADEADDTAEDPSESRDDEVAGLDEEDGESPYAESHATVSRAPEAAMSPSIYMVANPNAQIIEFEVKGPADLFAISRAAGIPFSTVKILNPELLRWCTPPTMKAYRIKLPLSSKSRFLATYNDESFERKVVFQQYKIKSGENLRRVAKKFAVEIDPIRELNNIPKGASALRVGSSIMLPIPTGYKRVIASMYDEKPIPPKKKRRRARRARRHVRVHSSAMRYADSARYSAASAALKYRLPPRVSTDGDE